MGFAILPHAVIVNYTKSLMLLHVPSMLTLCFMVTTVKTGSVLKLSWSLLPFLILSIKAIQRGTKACSRLCTSLQPVSRASDMKLLFSSLFVKVDL